jgi:GNAT superfamily N-acetyltransferase
MRRLDTTEARSLALKFAGDPRTARAHFAIEISGASVWRTRDSRCYAVASESGTGEVHIIGTGEAGELMEYLRPLAQDAQINMSRHMFAQISGMVTPRSVKIREIYTGPAGMTPTGVPPPRTDFDVRTVLYSDIPTLSTLPHDASFLWSGYKDPRNVLARSTAFGAFNGTRLVSLAIAELGRSFASIWTYTVDDLRGKGLATHCVASVMDHLRPTGERPLFTITAENGSPERAMARRFGWELAGDLAMVERRNIAL